MNRRRTVRRRGSLRSRGLVKTHRPEGAAPSTPCAASTCPSSGASSSPSPGPRAPASPRCCICSAASTAPTAAASGWAAARSTPQRGPLGGAAPPAHRHRLPVLQPGLQPQRRRQRRAARPAGRQLPAAGPRRPRGTAGGAGPEGQGDPHAGRAVRRRAAARRAGPRADQPPGLLLADEPAGSLDSKGTREVLRLLARFHQRGQTILLVTHDATDGERRGPGDQLLRRPGRRRRPPRRERRPPAAGVADVLKLKG